MLLCGQKSDDPRVQAAASWLTNNFRADIHPGKYPAERGQNRDAVYYYYCCSAARALKALAVRSHWADSLADELVSRQQPDGSWNNPLVPQRENDPLVATPFAVLALTTCRQALT